MASDCTTLRISYLAGSTIYAIARLSNGNIIIPASGLNEVYNSAHWTTYSIAFTSAGAGDYTAQIPALFPANVQIDLQFWLQAGGSPATSDTLLSSSIPTTGYWTGACWQDVTTYLINQTFGGAVITITTPVTESGDISPLVVGQDYTNGEYQDTRIAMTITGQPNLNDSTSALFHIYSEEGTELVSPAQQVDITSSTTLAIPLTHTQTSVLPTGSYRYEIWFVWGDGTKESMVRGNVNIISQSQPF